MARLGAWSMLPSSLAVEALGRSGAEFVGLDSQHGAHGFGDLVAAIQLLDLLGVESLVRVPQQDLVLIPRVLDFGASGVIVPMVERPETARQAVDLARYQPAGGRSWGNRRYGLSPQPDDPSEVRPAVWAMVETRQAVECLDELAAVPGLAGLFVGPVDLALALGVEGRAARGITPGTARAEREQGHAVGAWLEACERLVRVAGEHGIETATFARGGDDAREWAAAGFDRVVVSSDIALLRASLARELGIAAGTQTKT